MKINRCHGLDTLRAAAIILVFMFHCLGSSHSLVLKAMGAHVGWVGVDLFFVLSGYLIANQIFSSLINQELFSLKTFYFRRFIRTLPNYLFILGLYFTVPFFSEQPLTTPLWKFLTFTQNFGLSFSAFSHAWSLCIEEQFYFFLPIIILFIAYKANVRTGWLLVGFILMQFNSTKERTIGLDDFRSLFKINDKYLKFKDLNRDVIKPSIKEINNVSDLIVYCAPIKKGRNIVALVFDFKKNNQMKIDFN